MMKHSQNTLTLLLSALSALLLAAPLQAAPGGKLRTLTRGDYVCELPGDAALSRGIPVPEENFRVINASSYSSAEGSGTYLRKGDLVTITSGPRKGRRYSVKSDRFLRALGEDGEPTGLRCIRLGSTAN